MVEDLSGPIGVREPFPQCEPLFKRPIKYHLHDYSSSSSIFEINEEIAEHRKFMDKLKFKIEEVRAYPKCTFLNFTDNFEELGCHNITPDASLDLIPYSAMYLDLEKDQLLVIRDIEYPSSDYEEGHPEPAIVNYYTPRVIVSHKRLVPVPRKGYDYEKNIGEEICKEKYYSYRMDLQKNEDPSTSLIDFKRFLLGKVEEKIVTCGEMIKEITTKNTAERVEEEQIYLSELRRRNLKTRLEGKIF
jgi:hypothetical protein